MSSKDKGATAPKSAAERKRAERARKAEKGLFEVRGIYTDSAEKAEKIKITQS